MTHNNDKQLFLKTTVSKKTRTGARGFIFVSVSYQTERTSRTCTMDELHPSAWSCWKRYCCGCCDEILKH